MKKDDDKFYEMLQTDNWLNQKFSPEEMMKSMENRANVDVPVSEVLKFFSILKDEMDQN